MSWPLETLVSTFHNICKHQGGIKIDVVGDRIAISMRDGVQCQTDFDVQKAAIAAGLAHERVLSNVLIEFPGEAPRVPDVSILRDGRPEEPYSYKDLLAAVEIVSTKHDGYDFTLKREQYARSAVPAFLVIDPFRGECDLFTRPVDGRYAGHDLYTYGDVIHLKLADGGEVDIPTDTFDRRR
ncbi:Uma2 family endonuclease [Streptomyces hesseae]|uniref:Uma2 family endonuclease n=1 Tax=Streptomyces hesseae TaxID=3075519 RepID=A0ABU2SLW2_9ACTN|nr:Uma2 family endonuclease [Streptomyces sp. DSM 40473]MDT0449778.1 Uma2 family endonuclease [Streptomyces sp. DSM 40473]